MDAVTEIRNLVFVYAERIDAGDFEGLADLFTHAEMTFGGIDTVVHGREAALEQYRASTRLYPDGTPRTKHVTTNVQVHVDDGAGTAESRSYFTVFQQTPELPMQPIIGGRYEDRFERVDGAWRFSHRRIISDLFGDLSQHLLLDPSQIRPGV